MGEAARQIERKKDGETHLIRCDFRCSRGRERKRKELWGEGERRLRGLLV